MLQEALIVPSKQLVVAAYKSLMRVQNKAHEIALLGANEDVLSDLAELLERSLHTPNLKDLDVYVLPGDECSPDDFTGSQDTLPGIVEGAYAYPDKIIITISYYALYATAEDWKSFCKGFVTTMEHEIVHIEQYKRDNRPSELKSKDADLEFEYYEYLAEPKEIGAFAWTAYRELRKEFTPEEIKYIMSNNLSEAKEFSTVLSMYYDILGPGGDNENIPVLKKFLKTIYTIAAAAKPSVA